MHLGADGLLELTGTAHDAARRLRAGIESHPELALRGDPPATVFAFGAADPTAPGAPDIFAVGDLLAARGWYLDRQSPPDSLHVTVHAGHAATVDGLVADLDEVLAQVLEDGQRAQDRSTDYGAPGAG
jgi:sphinganine-1-phosphate aldolase